LSPTSTRRREKARDHRASVEAAILDSAEACLAAAPFRDLTVEDVMAPTGLGRTAFYRYFPDLDALLLRRLGQIAGEIETASRIWLSARGEPQEDLAVTATALAELFRAHGPLLGAVASASGPELEQAWRATVAAFVEPTTARIEAWIEDGSVVLESSARETARALVWMTERYLLESYREDPGLPTEVAAVTLATIWWRTLFPSMA
jgi:AcrR family transcriptional regulator